MAAKKKTKTVKISSETHRRAKRKAQSVGMKLEAWLEQAALAKLEP